MDELVEKAQIFLDILKSARGTGAADWTREDLERAYGWARYFEQAYARVTSKPQIAERLDRKLKVLASTEASPLGHQQFSLQLLGDAKQFVDQDAVAFSQLQSAVQLVGHMRELLHTNHNNLFHSGPANDCCQGRDIQVETDASLLLQFINLHLAESAQTQRTKQAIGRKLQEIVLHQQGWETVLTAMVLSVETHETTSAGPNIDVESNPISKFLLQWVLQQTGHNRFMFQVQTSLLVKVAAIYFSFYKAYLSYLVEWGKDMVVMEQAQQGRTWRHRTGEDQYSFDQLLSHVLGLLQGPPHVATATLKSLQSLPAPVTSPTNRSIWEEILQTPQIISIIQTKNLQE
ncbi:hypothetical protein Bbelb_138810 [Branchiostoma belcheri]|nr:hypothetical protein Bbelb_138810 [Branchiostoma belcheri]